VSKVSEQTAS